MSYSSRGNSSTGPLQVQSALCLGTGDALQKVLLIYLMLVANRTSLQTDFTVCHLPRIKVGPLQ